MRTMIQPCEDSTYTVFEPSSTEEERRVFLKVASILLGVDKEGFEPSGDKLIHGYLNGDIKAEGAKRIAKMKGLNRLAFMIDLCGLMGSEYYIARPTHVHAVNWRLFGTTPETFWQAGEDSRLAAYESAFMVGRDELFRTSADERLKVLGDLYKRLLATQSYRKCGEMTVTVVVILMAMNGIVRLDDPDELIELVELGIVHPVEIEDLG